MKPVIDPSWKKFLDAEFDKPYMKELFEFIDSEIAAGKKIYPSRDQIFEAFRSTSFDNVKAVILGQDPYHGEGQAHGLAFSVQMGVKVPPSLVNIYKELQDELKIKPPAHGNLTSWAKQGVLLLNNVLTVEDGKPASHHKKGWEIFTSKVIEILNNEKEHLVFILWGSPAQKKGAHIDESKHLVLKSVHPSPLSVYRGFYGSRPFSQTNKFLQSHGIEQINWLL